MTRQFDVVVEKDSEGYFVATVPALPGCHTQAKSLDELMSRIREAIELCLEVQGSPPPKRSEIIDSLPTRVYIHSRPCCRGCTRHAGTVGLGFLRSHIMKAY